MTRVERAKIIFEKAVEREDWSEAIEASQEIEVAEERAKLMDEHSL